MSTNAPAHAKGHQRPRAIQRHDDQHLTGQEFTLLMTGFLALGLSLLSFFAI